MNLHTIVIAEEDKIVAKQTMIYFKDKYSEISNSVNARKKAEILTDLITCYLIILVFEKYLNDYIAQQSTLYMLSYKIGMKEGNMRTLCKNGDVPVLSLYEVLQMCDYIGIGLIEIKKKVMSDFSIGKKRQLLKGML